MTSAEPNEPQHFRGHHTAGQRLVLAVNCLIVLLCFAAAIGLLIGKHAGENGRKVEINAGANSPTPSTPRPAVTAAPGQTLPENTTPETFPVADPQALNFLVTGADNSTDKSCVQLQDKGARTGERSDTIMVVRLDPVTKRSAILSFPRDLWVKIPGHGTSRINSAYRVNEPQLLIDTIKNEFGVSVDHFIQIDFCAFQKLVTAVGGVTVPLPYAVKDDEIGLDVFDPGCHTFNGDEALKYVRSRHLQYKDADGTYKKDPSSDLGRIARQQDFLRRTLTAALNNNLLRPKTIAALYASYRDDVLVDRSLTIDKMIQFVGVIKDVDTTNIPTYQVEATPKTVGGNAVLIWRKDSQNMQAILDIFRGVAPLAEAPNQKFEDTTTTSTLPHTTTSATAAESTPATTATTAAAPGGTLPVTGDTAPLSNAPPSAIVPDAKATC
jgi:LCP family protein required for cell wall assembly